MIPRLSAGIQRGQRQRLVSHVPFSWIRRSWSWMIRPAVDVSRQIVWSVKGWQGAKRDYQNHHWSTDFPIQDADRIIVMKWWPDWCHRSSRGIAWRPMPFKKYMSQTQGKGESRWKLRKQIQALSFACSTSLENQGVLGCFLYLNHSIVTCDGQCTADSSHWSTSMWVFHVNQQPWFWTALSWTRAGLICLIGVLGQLWFYLDYGDGLSRLA